MCVGVVGGGGVLGRHGLGLFWEGAAVVVVVCLIFFDK